MKTIMLVGEPLQPSKYPGGPRLFHNLLVKYLKKDKKVGVLDPRGESIKSNKIFQLIKIFKEYYLHKPSIIIITTFGFHIFFVRLLQMLNHFKIISVVHSLNKVSNFDKKSFSFSLNYFRNHLFRNYLENILLEHSSVQVFPSSFFLSHCIDKGYKIKNPKVIYHGVEEKNILKEKNADYLQGKFCIIGGLLKIKGTDKVERIINSLPDKYILQWIGYDKTDNVQRNNFVHQLESETFIIINYVQPENINSMLDESDILFVPSYFESFGIATIQSCARGVPVIISESVGAKEIVEKYNAGLICNFDSSDEIKKCIDKIFMNYTLYSSNAINLAKNNSWDKVVKKYLEII